MSTFAIGGKRYRVKSKLRFMTFITTMILIIVMICGFALGGEVSGSENPSYKTVTVQSGDTLWSIAQANKPANTSIRQYVSEIRTINEGIDPGRIYPGQTIKTPA
jgi:nucleoid-associated protein YgaU